MFCACTYIFASLIRFVGDEERHELRARTVLRVVGLELPLRLDGDAGPAEHGLEVVGIAEALVVVGADVHEHATAPIAEKVADDPLLLVL